MKTMLETLNETVAAYTSKTRAVEVSGCCHYHMDDGRMCAIDRCLMDPSPVRSLNGNVYSIHKRRGPLDSLLKPEYRGFHIDFWVWLQDLHDSPLNWDSNGLTLKGDVYAACIKQHFHLKETEHEKE